jgi:radical SAM superfamily enzyme YgiQ (UPF0313 family)
VIEDLDALPFPARHLVPYRRYSSVLTEGDCVTTVFTSRGCPYRCAFCDRPHLGTRFRARSPGNVVDEIAVCREMGISDFLFYDDTFAVDRQRAIRICDELVARKLRIRWDIRTRVDTVDAPLLDALARAGCRAVHYGIESGSERVLQALNKRIDLAQAEDAFRETRRRGMATLAYFMIGNPREGASDIEASFRLMRRLNPDYVHLTILTPFPGTQVYRMGLESGVIERDFWREFAADPTPDFIAPHWGETFTRDELQHQLARGYRQFYGRPRYALARLAKVRSLGQLRRQFAAGLQVLRMR